MTPKNLAYFASMLCLAGTSATAMPYCTAPPADKVAFADNIQALDTYVASVSPGFDAGYVADFNAMFGQGAPLSLSNARPSFITPEASEACAAIEAGTATSEQVQRAEAALLNSEIWFRLDIEPYDRWSAASSTAPLSAYISARYVAFIGRDQWFDRYGPKLGSWFDRIFSKRIIDISGANSADARMRVQNLQHSVVRRVHNFMPTHLLRAYSDNIDTIGIVDGIYQLRINEAYKFVDFTDRGDDFHWDSSEIAEYTWAASEGYVTANCPARLLDGGSVESEHGSVAHWGSGPVVGLGNFFRLCPEESRAIARENCNNGDDEDCRALNRHYLSSTCAVEEDTLFSCRISGRQESVSICQRDGDLSYVFGAATGSDDLRLTQSLSAVEAYSPRGVFDETPLVFHNDDYTYEVNTSFSQSRVRVSRGTTVLANLFCAD